MRLDAGFTREGAAVVRSFSVALVVAVAVCGILVWAQAPAAHRDDWTRVGQSAAPSGSTTLRMRGTVGKYDSSTRNLSIDTEDAVVDFQLPEDVHVRLNGHSIDTARLATLIGYRAVIRFSESTGAKAVRSVNLFGK